MKKHVFIITAALTVLVLILSSCSSGKDDHVHEFGDWVILREATDTEYGVMERICKTCGQSETSKIEPKGGTPAGPSQPAGSSEADPSAGTEPSTDPASSTEYAAPTGPATDPGTPVSVTVMLDPAGGAITSTYKIVTVGGTYGELPYPERAGFTFRGWRLPDGTTVEETTKVTLTNDHVLKAVWRADRLGISWVTPNHAVITVIRTSSPSAGAELGTITSGEAVYYGDVLKISYAAEDGYYLTGTGITDITVTGDVFSGIECSVEKKILSTDPVFLAENRWFWTRSNVTGVYYTATVYFKDRTETSVTAVVTWTQTCTANSRYGYDQSFTLEFRAPGGEVSSSGKVLIASFSAFGKNSDNSVDRVVTVTKEFTVTGLTAGDTKLQYVCTPTTSDTEEFPTDFGGEVSIQAFH